MTRILGEEFINDILKNKYDKIHEYDEKIKDNGLFVVLFLRFIPIFPFNGLNFALGLTKVKSKDYILGTLIGIIPGSFVLAFFGGSFSEMNFVNTIIAIVLFLLMMAVYPIYKKYNKK